MGRGSGLNGTNPQELHPADATNLINWTQDEEFNPVSPDPTLRVEPIGSNTLLNCTTSPDRLDPSVVTINGVTYGCGTGGDDAGTASCNL